MSDEKSLINLGDLTKPVTVLIEKVSNAIGVLYEPRRIKKIGQANAAVKKIEAITELEISDLQRRGLERIVNQSARKQNNIENIISNAIVDIPDDAETEKIEEDWIAHFFGKCENVSDKEMQSLWSRILAGEARKPQTFSKKTLNLVASLDKSDAELFTSLSRFVWMVSEKPVPIFFDTDHEIYIDNKIRFIDLKHLDYLGLISFDATSGYKLDVKEGNRLMGYFSRSILINFQNSKKNEIQLGKVMLTKAGEELFKICAVEYNSDFYFYVIQKLFDQGLCISSRL